MQYSPTGPCAQKLGTCEVGASNLSMVFGKYVIIEHLNALGFVYRGYGTLIYYHAGVMLYGYVFRELYRLMWGCSECIGCRTPI